jgi:hypothetical protein
MVMELQYQKVLFSNERTRAESGSKQFPVDRLNENLCVSGEQIVRYYDAKKYPRIFTEAENRAKLTLTFTSYLVLLSTEETRIQEAEAHTGGRRSFNRCDYGTELISTTSARAWRLGHGK